MLSSMLSPGCLVTSENYQNYRETQQESKLKDYHLWLKMSVSSFSTNFEDYWTSNCYRNFSNGTIVYYNFTDAGQASCNCVCSFKGDPDIAGPGVKPLSHLDYFSRY